MNLNLKQKKAIAIVVIFSVVMIGAGLLIKSSVLDRFQLQISPMLYQTRKSSAPIVIVGLDAKTVDQLGNSGAWARDTYAQAINNIFKYEPAVVGVDIAFINKGIVPVNRLEQLISDSQSSGEVSTGLSKLVGGELIETDQAFAKTIADHDNLVLLRPPVKNFSLENLQQSKLNVEGIYPPFNTADQNRLGTSNLQDEPDGSLRKYVPIARGDKDYLSFALAIISKYWQDKNVKVVDLNDNQAVIDFDGKELKIPLSNFQFLINFSSKTLSQQAETIKDLNYSYVSFLDVYNNQWSGLDPAELKGKIVLIGPYIQNNDNYKTPIDTYKRMPGVMIHGQAIQTILDQAWLRDMSAVETIGFAALLTILALAMIFVLRIGFALIGVTVEILVYCGLIAPLLFKTGVIANLIYPPLAVILAVIIGYAYRYLTEFKQKNKVAGALGQYVNANVAQSVLESNQNVVKSGGEKKLISILFSDIAGFTTISEGMTPENLVKLLNEYFEVMAGAIERSGGIIDKYIGDAIMALFEGEDHAEKAAKAALEMRKALAEWKASGEADRAKIDFRVGVACGEVVVGNIGSSQHIQYTAIGDIVNLASRLEGANKHLGSKILVSGPVFEKVADHFEFRFINRIVVKGKTECVDCYEILANKGEISADMKEFLEVSRKALEMYFQRDFQGADQFFQKEILPRWPNDMWVLDFAEQLKNLVKNPPAADWNFAIKLEEK